MLQVDLAAKRARNLSALQKIDGNVLEIVSEASHTALYKFDAASTKWERYAMEGAVFITRNCLEPFYSLIVLNKMGPDDFILDLSTVQKAKIQDSYVMLRYSTGGAPIIMGFWLRDDNEREELLQSVTCALTASNNAGTSNKSSSFPSSLTMKLTAAAQQINIKKVTPAPAPIPTPPSSYAAALGIPKQPSPTTTTGGMLQASSSALAIMQAIGSGTGGSGNGISSSSVGAVVNAEGTSSGTGGGAGMGLLQMLRAQPASTTTNTTTNNNNNNNNNNMAPTASTSSSNSVGQTFLTDREISAMKTNQHQHQPTILNSNAGSSGSAINVVSSSVIASSAAGGSSKGATNMLLAALQITTTTTTSASSGMGLPSEAAASTAPSSSPDTSTRMIPIPLSALLGTRISLSTYSNDSNVTLYEPYD